MFYLDLCTLRYDLNYSSNLQVQKPLNLQYRPPLMIYSTLIVLVEQGEYFFDMSWKKAIPARQRIKEIEENLKREFIETIQHSEETVSLISKVLSSATDEILIVFSRADSLTRDILRGIYIWIKLLISLTLCVLLRSHLTYIVIIPPRAREKALNSIIKLFLASSSKLLINFFKVSVTNTPRTTRPIRNPI